MFSSAVLFAPAAAAAARLSSLFESAMASVLVLDLSFFCFFVAFSLDLDAFVLESNRFRNISNTLRMRLFIGCKRL